MKYRKKPVVIEAIQLKDENLDKIREFCKGKIITIIQESGGYVSMKSCIAESDLPLWLKIQLISH